MILFCGSVIEMPWFEDVKAVLYMGLPGQAGGLAAADLLTGKVNPSGKLTETWPLSLGSVPSGRTFGRKYTAYTEGIYVGYRYYDKAGISVRLPFGHGLSYTEFSYSDLKISGRTVTAVIANTGKTAGAETVQLYVCAPQNGIHRPKKELKGFVKVFLAPGEQKKVSFTLDDRSFGVWQSGWKIQKGTYAIALGASSQDIRLSGEMQVEGEDIAVPNWQKGSWYETLQGQPSDHDFEAAFGGPIVKEPEIRKGSFTMEMSTMEMRKHSMVMNQMFKIFFFVFPI